MSRRLWIGMVAVAALRVATSAQAGEVVLYSSNSVEAINAVTDEFNKKYPNIKISPVRGSTGAMMQRIKAEAVELTLMPEGARVDVPPTALEA